MSADTNSYTAEALGLKLRASITEDGVHLDGAESSVDLEPGRQLRSFNGTLADGTVVPLYVEESDSDHEYTVYVCGHAVHVHLVTTRDERLLALRKNTRVAGSAGQIVSAPMPGLLKVMLVAEGDHVEKGAPLCILEAMKMENEIKSPGRLVVKRLIARSGSAVEKGAPLVELQPPAEL